MDKNWSYFAGFFDGEGSVSINPLKKKQRKKDGGLVNSSLNHVVVLSISNCNFRVIDNLKKEFGGTTYMSGKSSSGKEVFRWTVAGNAAGPILEHIYPFVVAKKEVVGLALEFMDKRCLHKGIRPSIEEMAKREWYRNEIKRINAID